MKKITQEYLLKQLDPRTYIQRTGWVWEYNKEMFTQGLPARRLQALSVKITEEPIQIPQTIEEWGGLVITRRAEQVPSGLMIGIATPVGYIFDYPASRLFFDGKSVRHNLKRLQDLSDKGRLTFETIVAIEFKVLSEYRIDKFPIDYIKSIIQHDNSV